MAGCDRVCRPDDVWLVPANYFQAGQNGTGNPAGPTVRSREHVGITAAESEVPRRIEAKRPVETERLRNQFILTSVNSGIRSGLGRQYDGLQAGVRQMTSESQCALHAAASAQGRKVERDHEDLPVRNISAFCQLITAVSMLAVERRFEVCDECSTIGPARYD